MKLPNKSDLETALIDARDNEGMADVVLRIDDDGLWSLVDQPSYDMASYSGTYSWHDNRMPMGLAAIETIADLMLNEMRAR